MSFFFFAVTSGTSAVCLDRQPESSSELQPKQLFGGSLSLCIKNSHNSFLAFPFLVVVICIFFCFVLFFIGVNKHIYIITVESSCFMFELPGGF